jgi:hypothetical protein
MTYCIAPKLDLTICSLMSDTPSAGRQLCRQQENTTWYVPGERIDYDHDGGHPQRNP